MFAILSELARPVHQVRVNGAYKRKAQKVRPVDLGESDGSKPGGVVNWVAKSRKADVRSQDEKYSGWLIPKFSDIERGSRLTKKRLEELIVGADLTLQERDVFEEMLYNREKAMAFDWQHKGMVRPEVAPPQVIRMVKHKAWQVPGFPIPKALVPIVCDMLRERLQAGVLEPCYGPYRNPWFLVKKKNGKYRLVNAAMEYNKHTVRDANLPPSVDEFSEEFAGCQLASLIDFFSGYDQVPLDEKSRDITAFHTPLGLLRQTTLPQGATNSVAQFVRIVTKILEDLIPHDCMPFLDDVGVKGPTTTYNNTEVLPGVRKFVMEHIQALDRTLERIERAGCTIGPKSQFCMNGVVLVGFVCGAEGRTPETAKVIKILEWRPCANVREARAFIGVCVYYRIWIPDFAVLAKPIYRLFKKGVAWEWMIEHDIAMAALKKALTEAPALVRIDYAEGAGAIVLGVDASLEGWGAHLGQEDENGRVHPSRYESGLWNQAEAKYDATKRECRAVLKALRKVRFWLYGVHFVLETDANVLVAQLNRSATDLPGSLVTRWIAYIRLFDFEVRHVPGRKHTAADGLSRRPRTRSDDVDECYETDIEDFIDAELGALSIAPVRAGGQEEETAEEKVLEEGYSEDSQKIARFLTTLRKPSGMGRGEFRAFKKRAVKYAVIDKQLYRLGSKNVPSRIVIDAEAKRREILKELHEECGHKGRESTYRKVADRYYWEGCFEDTKKFVASCAECQFRDPLRLEEALYPTYTSAMWVKVGLDIVHMPPCQGKEYLVIAREDLSGWPEARALVNATSEAVARFLWEDVVCRHGCFGRLVIDGGPENKAHVAEFVRRYGIRRVQVSAYHPQGNGMIERGHRPITEALARMTKGGSKGWVKALPAVLLADRTTIHGPTGETPFFMLYGREAILPIELRYPTWRVLDWENVKTREDLIAVRARQLELRDEDVEEVMLRKRRKRMEGKEAFDNLRRVRTHPINVGDVVLRHDAKKELDRSTKRKLSYKWLGPYRVRSAVKEKGTYELEEFDGTPVPGTHPGNRLKKFVKRKGFYEPVEEEEVEGEGTEEEREIVRDISEEGNELEAKPTGFEIRVPTLTAAQRREYLPYEEDDEGNIL
jgi:hypothetical protein